MKISCVVLLCAVVAACSPSGEPAGAPAAPDVTDNVRRLAAILDYVAADYAGAVKDGAVAIQFEYDEQLEFLGDAETLAAKLPPKPGLDVAGDLANLRALIVRIAPGPEVAAAARAARGELLAAYGVVLAPAAPPQLERGRTLYAENCTACHGVDGRGDGPEAHEHDPAPRSFHDPEVMVDLTPARAFNALTDGLEGTAMASYGLLSPSDRWSLAFYVFRFRHDPAAVERGASAAARIESVIAATPSRLAGLSDGDIDRALAGAGLDEVARAEALAYLRAEAPYRASGAPMDAARQGVAQGVAAYRAGDQSGALTAFGAAYLDGFEPHEAALQAVDHGLVVRVEHAFLDLRAAVSEGEDAESVEQRALQLGVLLDSADEALAGSGGKVAFAGSFFVILREGLEGALLVLLLLGFARRAGASERDARAVHAGWLAAVGLGVITWFASDAVVKELGGARRELLEGVVALLAAVVLLMASHFVIARIDAKRRVAQLKDKLDAAISTPRRRWVLASLAFVAVYREAFEVVLFLQAILLDASASGGAVAGGALAAAALLVVVVIAMQRLGKRLEPGPLLTASGALLCVLAVVLAGKGVRSLQEAGVVGIDPLGAVRIDWLGLYPTMQTIAAQVAVVVAFAAIAGWALGRARTPDTATP